MQKRKLLMIALAIGLGLTAYGQEKPKISRVTAERTFLGRRTDPIRVVALRRAAL